MEKLFKLYNPDDAPAILMTAGNHYMTFGVFNRVYAEIARRQGGSRVDWSRVQPGTAWRLAEEQLEAAGVPPHIREEFFREFNKYLDKFR